MSYSISISGHTDGEEEAIADAAARFAQSLDGVSSATGSFGGIGTVDLQQREVAADEPEPDTPEAPAGGDEEETPLDAAGNPTK